MHIEGRSPIHSHFKLRGSQPHRLPTRPRKIPSTHHFRPETRLQKGRVQGVPTWESTRH